MKIIYLLYTDFFLSSFILGKNKMYTFFRKGLLMGNFLLREGHLEARRCFKNFFSYLKLAAEQRNFTWGRQGFKLDSSATGCSNVCPFQTCLGEAFVLRGSPMTRSHLSAVLEHKWHADLKCEQSQNFLNDCYLVIYHLADITFLI